SLLLRTLAAFVVVAASAYSIVLCGALTAGAPISNAIVAAADGAIVIAAPSLASLRRIEPGARCVIAIAINFFPTSVLAQHVELKGLRDALIIVAFLNLGLAAGDRRWALWVFTAVGVLVIGFALYEYVAPQAYVDHFNVLRFYVARGAVDARQAQFDDNS